MSFGSTSRSNGSTSCAISMPIPGERDDMLERPVTLLHDRQGCFQSPQRRSLSDSMKSANS
jgi:hypothetical protein